MSVSLQKRPVDPEPTMRTLYRADGAGWYVEAYTEDDAWRLDAQLRDVLDHDGARVVHEAITAALATAGSDGDAFERLDDALAVQRALSRRIRIAAERGDAAALQRFSVQREQLSDRITGLLRLTATMLPEAYR